MFQQCSKTLSALVVGEQRITSPRFVAQVRAPGKLFQEVESEGSRSPGWRPQARKCLERRASVRRFARDEAWSKPRNPHGWWAPGVLQVIGILIAALPALALADDQIPAGVASVASSFSASGGESMVRSSIRMLGGLLLCLALLAAGLKVYQRFNPTATVGRARRLEVKERVAISSKASLTLVSLDGREFLVASGSEAVSVIPTRTKADDVFDQSLAEIYKEGEVCDAQ